MQAKCAKCIFLGNSYRKFRIHWLTVAILGIFSWMTHLLPHVIISGFLETIPIHLRAIWLLLQIFGIFNLARWKSPTKILHLIGSCEHFRLISTKRWHLKGTKFATDLNSKRFTRKSEVVVLFKMIRNGYRTEWSPILSVIIRVITKSDDRAAGVRFVYHEYDYRLN